MSDPFDILQAELVRVAAQPRCAQTSNRRSRGRVAQARPRRWPRRPLALAIALVGVSAGAGGLAVAGTFNSGTISPQAWASGGRVTPETQLTPDQTADLAVLRQPHVASDALPQQEAQPLTDSPGFGGAGVSTGLSRRAQGVQGGAAWVIPGNDGTICLVADNTQALTMFAAPQSAQSPTSELPGPLSITGCTTAASIDKTGWWAGSSGNGAAPGVLFTAGIVPDGVTSVTVNLVGGTTIALQVNDNVFMGEVHAVTSSVAGQRLGSPLSVTYPGANGPITLNS